MPTARCFIALDISDALKKKIERVREKIFLTDLGIRWVRPENLHLTLKFLGDVKLDKIDEIIEAIRSLELPEDTLHLQFNMMGVFPDLKHPRIIWLGSDENPALTRLASDLENSLAKMGFSKEKREFKSHLTIGRVKPKHDAKGIAEAVNTAADKIASEEVIKLITLYKSRLSSEGPQYEVLHQRHFRV